MLWLAQESQEPRDGTLLRFNTLIGRIDHALDQSQRSRSSTLRDSSCKSYLHELVERRQGRWPARLSPWQPERSPAARCIGTDRPERTGGGHLWRSRAGGRG